MQQHEIPKQYDPKAVEERWKFWWHEKGFFASKPELAKDPYTIMMPPPNVTGVLHMGHALQDTIQDTLIRYHRMLGYNAHWQAGKDHAGIATQTVVERQMKKSGEVGRIEMGRDKFIERVWEFVEKNRDTITRQKMALGDSADWTRERFTLDEGMSTAVREVFVRLHKEGLIYRGPYIVNWSPQLQSAISDEEVDHKEVKGHLWHILYPAADGGEGVVVATTRPETMLGDTAVMVHPDDDRYKDLVGKEVTLPLSGRTIPVIADDYVDREFGTGVVKVTPAHDPNDFEVGKRHDLEMPVILDESAKICSPAPLQYIGMDRFEAREKIVEDLEAEGLMVKIEEYTHSVGYCSRTKVPIEPYLSTQWFLKMKPLAEPAIEAVRSGQIKFVPQRWENVYFQWMENIRDWCISRQLWWGHRIPAWYCQDCSHVMVETDKPGRCPVCGSERMKQEEDVLDTWFSSWLFTFSTLGWPKTTADLLHYHPTDVLVSGYDIIFFWIARMIMASLHFTDEIPFKTVYITGMIKDKQGRWMSKSLGNGIDPLEMIEQYGADAVRYCLTVLNSPGQDIRLDPSRFEMGRNFANKLWNSFRFLANRDLAAVQTAKGDALEVEDRWIEGRLIETSKLVQEKIEQYRLDDALMELYRFIWNDFCDWYIEAIKPRIADDADPAKAAQTLRFALETYNQAIHILHPFMPFITEEIYQTLLTEMGDAWKKDRPESIALGAYPVAEGRTIDKAAVEEFGYVQELVSAIRNVRGELLVSPAKEAKLVVPGNEPRLEIIKREWSTIKRLARIEGDVIEADAKPSTSASTLVEGREVYIPLEGLIDLDSERDRVKKEIGKLEGLINGQQKKLANEKFVANAPEELVANEREKLTTYEADKEKLTAHLADLG
ncbi:valine--tRNA ligase [bacterium]|nr:valine--tRNA ligase [bacterium]